MTVPAIITFDEGQERLDWLSLTEALVAGHRLPSAEINDSFLHRGPDTLLCRSAWIDGMGSLVKSATVFPGNPAGGKPAVNGGVQLFSDADGVLEAIVDFHLLTKWKTAGDSLLAARRLARPESREILIVGAGTVGHSLREAYAAAFPDARFSVWNRTQERASCMAGIYPGTRIAPDLEVAVSRADIVACATMSFEPIIRGEWLRPGQHIDLIGAYRHDMRETDDDALRRASIFVDSRETALEHIGELKQPLASGAIIREDVRADYYDMDAGCLVRSADDEITLFKNGGGAHIDLMTARYILEAWKND